MNKKGKPIEHLVRELSPAEQAAVRAFVKSLRSKETHPPRKRPESLWAGALKDLSSQFTSVELQHHVARWRDDAE